MNKFKPFTTAFVHNVWATNNSQIFTHICDVKQRHLFFFATTTIKNTPKTIRNQNEKIRALDIHQIKNHINTPYSVSNTNKINHPAAWTSRHTRPTEFSLTPPSVSDRLHILAVLSTQFHTKLNGFQQIAYLFVTMREILSNSASWSGFQKWKMAI